MSAEHLLSKLTPHGAIIENTLSDVVNNRLQPIPFAAKGKPSPTKKRAEIASSDVAAALAGLPNIVYYYALARFADDRGAAKKCWSILNKIAAERWPEITPAQCNVLALLAIEGKIWGKQCKNCDGQKTAVTMTGKIVDCQRCRGSGIAGISGVHAARMLGISPAAYSQTWLNRVALLQSELDSYEFIALAHVKRQFKTNDLAKV